MAMTHSEVTGSDTVVAPLPRRRHLLAGTVVVRCGPSEVQVGVDARWAVRIADVADDEYAWLRALASGARYTRALVRAHGVRQDRARLIWDTLDEAGFVVHEPPPDGPWPANDVFALAHLRADGDGARTLAHRSRRCVGVSGLGPLGLSVAQVLAAAGVGSLVLDDARPVTRADVVPGGYRHGDLAVPRQQAAEEIVGRRSRGGGSAAAPPDLVVVVETWAHDARRFARLCAQDVPHLAALVREADVAVGPFVVPGKSPCVRCLDLTHRASDPQWPDISAHLRSLPPGRTGEETVLVATGAALVAGQVLAALDGGRPRTDGAVLECSLPDAVPRVRTLAPHPACGCGADGTLPGSSTGTARHAAPLRTAS